MKPTRRYLVFAGPAYFPSGGWDDFRGSIDSLDDIYPFLKTSAASTYDDWVFNEDGSVDWKMFWAHVIDSETLERIWADGVRIADDE